MLWFGSKGSRKMVEARTSEINSPTGAQSVWRWARDTPTAIAVIEAGYQYTYANVAELIVRMVALLRSFDVAPGTIVGIECSSRYLHLVLILACECLGAATVSLAATELNGENEVLGRCGLLCLEADPGLIAASPAVLRLTGDLLMAIARSPVTADDFRCLDFQPLPEAPGRIVKSSGTTGRPKLMCNSSIGIRRGIEMTKSIYDGLNANYNFIAIYQFSFRPTYTDSLLALRYGGKVLYSTIAGFRADLSVIGNCHTVVLPLDAMALCAAFRPFGRPDTECVVVINGGASSARLHQELLDTVACRLCVTYSTNETNYIALVDENGVGPLLAGAEVKILGEAFQEVARGESGLIAVRSIRMVSGYLWDDALTARHFVGGWHRTSDFGYLRPDGQLVVLGRADDMLNIGGVKVPPHPIEAEISAMPDVGEAVLLGIENTRGVYELHLVVERPDPIEDIDVHRRIRRAIHQSGRDFVTHYVDCLPRTETGKIMRGALRRMIERPTEPK
jgi:acyl-coenzyme A synthetase/AMP-(fatty) acid ligase